MKKRIPLIKRYKKQLPEYGGGGTSDATIYGNNDTMYSGAKIKPNGFSKEQYGAAAASIAMGAGQAIQANNNNSLSDIEKANGINKGIDNAGIGVATAVNPLLGTAVATGKKFGDNIRLNVDKTDVNGNLVNENKSKMGQIGSAIFDPRMGLVEAFKDPEATTGQKVFNVLTGGAGDAFTSRHKNFVERSAKAPILEQQRLEQEQALVNQRMLKDQELQANIALNAAYGGKMPKYAMGGQPNAEVEGGGYGKNGENTLAPDGSTTQYNGPTHEQGGILTQLQPGEMVFSNRLKMPGTKKTFAQLNEVNNTNKEDKILNNDVNDNYKKLSAELMKKAKNKKSLELFQAQEGLKEAKLQNYAKKLGITGSNFAWGGKNRNGLYDDAPVTPDLAEAKYQREMADTQFVPTMVYNEDTVVPPSQGFATQPYGYTGPDVTEPQKQYPTTNINQTLPEYTEPASKDYSAYKQLGQGFLQSAGPITSLIMAGKLDKDKYDRVTPQQVSNPNLLDPSQAIRDVNRSYVGIKDAIGSRSSGNTATYLANLQAANAQKMNAESRIRKDYDNANAGIKNQFLNKNTDIVNQSKYFNAGTQKEEFVANQMNKGQRRNVVADSISNIGQNVNSQIRDNNADAMDQETLNLIATRYPEMLNNPEIKKWYDSKIVKTTKTKKTTKKD